MSRLAEKHDSMVAGGVMVGRPRPPSGSKGRAIGRGPGGQGVEPPEALAVLKFISTELSSQSH